MSRAITHGDIDSTVYSQMADDLENAVRNKRKGNKTASAAKKTKGTKKVRERGREREREREREERERF